MLITVTNSHNRAILRTYPVSSRDANAAKRTSLTANPPDFDTEFTKEKPTLTPVQQQLSAADQAEFAGFSWVSSFQLSSGLKRYLRVCS